MSSLETSSILCFNFSVVFLKDLFLDLFSSAYTPLLSVLSHLIHLQIMICMRMIILTWYSTFSSFSAAADFAYTISHLEQTICNVYNWMSSNFLSLNPSEFLFVGLPQQLSKLSNPINHLLSNVILSPVHSAPNLGVIFDSNLTLLNTFMLFVNHAFVMFVTSDAFEMLLIILQPVLFHFKRDYCNSLLLNLPSIQTISNCNVF
jgi:hypothetical protein